MAENILHFAGVRYRVNGSGNLQQVMYGLDNVDTTTLTDLVLAESPGREPTVLANLVTQRASLKVFVEELDEWFKINRIILFAKPVYSQYPG